MESLKVLKEERLFNRYTKCKSAMTKAECLNYKILRNQLTTLIKQNKNRFYEEYFTKNNKNLRMMKGIKEIINVKSKSYDSPTCFN